MASFIGFNKELSCPICAGRYCTPRKLPGCVHSFCEKCILNFIINLKKDNKLHAEFECPVCKLPSKSPGQEGIITEWVQTMERDTELEAKTENQEESSSEWCSQCRDEDKFIKTKVYCTICQESFCEPCSRTIHSLKMNKSHVLIDITEKPVNESVHEQAVRLLNDFLTCKNHPGKRVELYCEDDAVFCCGICSAKHHQQCSNVKSVQELSETDEKTKPVRHPDSFTKLADNIQTIVGLMKDKESEMKKDPEKLCSDFQNMKQKVVQLLDAIEDKLSQESKAEAKAISIKISDEAEELNNDVSNLQVVAYLLQNLVEKLPQESATICVQEASRIFHHVEGKIVDIGPAWCTQRLSLKMKDVFSTIVNLGPNETESLVSIQTKTEFVPLPKCTDRVLLSSCALRKIDTEIIRERRVKTSPKFVSLLFLPNNQLVLVDGNHENIYLLDELTNLVGKASLQVKEESELTQDDTNFVSATYIPDNLIAVCVSETKKIIFLSADHGLERKSEITCKFPPLAIHGLSNGDIAVLWSDPAAVGIIALKGGSYKEKIYFDKDKQGRSLVSNTYMAVDETRQRFILPGKSAQATGIVRCYDFNGNKIFGSTYGKMIDPRGVALDADGNIYVCANETCVIFVLSPKGSYIKVIEEVFPTQPLALAFNKEGSILAVTQTAPDSRAVDFFSLIQED